MTSLEAKHELIRTLDITKSIIKKELSNNKVIDHIAWFEQLDRLITSNVNGLKRLCFDNGELHLFKKMSDDILSYWNQIKNEALEDIG